ncbi:MAG TPA: hypothetical protein VF429_10530 [Anaerolineae bacterium]|jgi:hypothetical protein
MTEDSFTLELDPVDWQQLELLARVSPARRLLTMMEASEFSLAGLRGAFRKRFPELSQSELNMKVLAYVTPLRGWKPK